MKIDLIIKDATTEEATAILNLIQDGLAINVEKEIGQSIRYEQPVAVTAPTIGTVVSAAVDLPESNHSPDDLDARGFPWHEKIHSSNQEKTAKGVWTKKRGCDEATTLAVESELRALGFGNVGVTTSATLQPITPVAPASYAQHEPYAAVTAVAQQQFTPPVVAPVAPVQTFQPATMQAPVVAGPKTFAEMMAHISVLFNTARANQDYLTSLCQRVSQAFGVQVNNIVDVQNNQAMVDYVFQLFAVDGKA